MKTPLFTRQHTHLLKYKNYVMWDVKNKGNPNHVQFLKYLIRKNKELYYNRKTFSHFYFDELNNGDMPGLVYICYQGHFNGVEV